MSTKIAESIQNQINTDDLKQRLYTQGICSYKRAFSPAWAEQLRKDHALLMDEAMTRETGFVSRGRNRLYHAVYPERLSGFLDLITHPFFTGVSEAVLGKDYSIVEIGFDVPMHGAKNQPWHRDFAIGTETSVGRWLSSLVFNMTTVDVTPEMGALEYVPGTQWEDGIGFEDGMVPPEDQFAWYEKNSLKAYPKAGDISCRTGLMIHRGTEHKALIPRPVLCIGVVADTVVHSNKHNVHMTKQYFNSLPPEIRQHLKVELNDGLQPIIQSHDLRLLK